MKVLEVEKISKSFGDFKAVDGVSFSLGEGTILGLLGPNGAGKTTSIRMIMNIIIPDSGKVRILGKESSAANDLMLAQRLDPCMSEVFDWRDMPLAHMKMLRNEHKPGNMAVLVQAPVEIAYSRTTGSSSTARTCPVMTTPSVGPARAGRALHG